MTGIELKIKDCLKQVFKKKPKTAVKKKEKKSAILQIKIYKNLYVY